MTQGHGPDRERPDLTKRPSGLAPTAEPVVADQWSPAYWAPYDSAGFRDPLAGLDPVYPPPPGSYPMYPNLMNPYAPIRTRTNSMANAAMICALVSIPATFVCLGALLAPAAVIMGFVGLSQMRSSGESGGAQAWTGIAIGGLMTSFLLMIIVPLALAIGG